MGLILFCAGCIEEQKPTMDGDIAGEMMAGEMMAGEMSAGTPVTITGCDLRLKYRYEGGYCGGPCVNILEITGDGFLFDQRDNFEGNGITRLITIHRQMTETQRVKFNQLLGRIDVSGLEDGYGECCNSYIDGADLHITFYADGEEVRDIRFTDVQDAPQEAVDLIEFIRDLRNNISSEIGEDQRCVD